MLGDPSIPLTSRLQVQTILSAPAQPDLREPTVGPAAALQHSVPGLSTSSKEAGQPETTVALDEPPASKRPCLANSRDSDSNACSTPERTTPDMPQHPLGTVQQGQSGLRAAESRQPSSPGTGASPHARQEQAQSMDRACMAADAGHASTTGIEPEADEHTGQTDTLEGMLHRKSSQPKQLSSPHTAAHAQACMSLPTAHAPVHLESQEHSMQPATAGCKAGDVSAMPSQALPLNCHERVTGNGAASCSKPSMPAAGNGSAGAVSDAAASPEQIGHQDAAAQRCCSEASLSQGGVSSAEVPDSGAGLPPSSGPPAGVGIAR